MLILFQNMRSHLVKVYLDSTQTVTNGTIFSSICVDINLFMLQIWNQSQ